MKREKPSWIDRTAWMPWRRRATSQKPVPHFINNRPANNKAEKYGPRLIMLVNSFYA